MGEYMDKYDELLNEIEILTMRLGWSKDDNARLRNELTKALSLLSEWAPHTFEKHYMSADQRASLEREDNEAGDARRAALDAPGHTDLMVSPESLDAWLEDHPQSTLDTDETK